MQASDTSAAGIADAPTGEPEEEQKAVPDLAFYSFPTLEQLSAASEAALRAEGFGYRSAPCLSPPVALQEFRAFCAAIALHLVNCSHNVTLHQTVWLPNRQVGCKSCHNRGLNGTPSHQPCS